MSAEEFLSSTPVEINWKIEAYNDARRDQAARDYRLVNQLGWIWHDPAHAPQFERFYPETDPVTKKQKVDSKTAKAINTAKALGHF
ncbi:hypothetical protein M0R72_19070 [Candidatus Pacearchaeota archaeon]|jgi:hypothetical protein|nr:hypothetical protein [Candidatus Pacearchaeota archaeon]